MKKAGNSEGVLFLPIIRGPLHLPIGITEWSLEQAQRESNRRADR